MNLKIKNLVLFLLLFLMLGIESPAQEMKLITFSQMQNMVIEDYFSSGSESGFVIALNAVGPWSSLILKIDSLGNPVSGCKFNQAVNRSWQLCSDKGYLFLEDDPIGFGYALVKTDSVLNILWAKVPDQHLNPSVTYNYTVFERGGYNYLCSSIDGSNLYSHNYNSGLSVISKFDNGGNFINQIIIGDSTDWAGVYNLTLRYATSIPGDPNIYLSGYAKNCQACPNSTVIICKIDSLMNVEWTKSYFANYITSNNSLMPRKNGHLLMSGSFKESKYKAYIAELDTSGNIIFAKKYSEPKDCGTIATVELNDRSLMFSRFSTDTINGTITFFDFADSIGQISNSKTVELDNFWSPFYLAVNSNGTVGTYSLYGTDSILFLPLDTTLSGFCISNPQNLSDSLLTITPVNQNFSLFSYPFSFSDTVIQPCQPLNAITSDACSILMRITEISAHSNLIYPNPTNGNFTITTFDPKSYVEIYNSLGEILSEHQIQSGHFEFNDKLNPGIYFVKVKSTGGSTVNKLLVW